MNDFISKMSLLKNIMENYNDASNICDVIKIIVDEPVSVKDPVERKEVIQLIRGLSFPHVTGSPETGKFSNYETVNTKVLIREIEEM